MKNNVIRTKFIDETPKDEAISRHLQNLFATYGEDAVKKSLKELFNLKTVNQKHKKEAV